MSLPPSVTIYLRPPPPPAAASAALRGVGMILANRISNGEGLVGDAHLLPACAVGANQGDAIKAYISSSKNPTATLDFKGTILGIKPAPVLASFSARGPNGLNPQILKPDLIAPGVNILAAWTDAVGPTGLDSDTRRTEFNILSGTSMACPHVSGAAALLKSAHPDWSPAAVRSAMMTTATLLDNRNLSMLDEATGNTSTPYDLGAGHLNLGPQVKVESQVKGVTVTVRPLRLVFTEDVKKRSYVVTVAADTRNLKMSSSGAVFGSLSWTDGKHVVRSPVVER